MKLTITCQVCGKVLCIIEKDQISDADIAMYQAGSYCDTVVDTITDEDGNTVTLFDAQTSIQATKTVS